MGLKTPRFVVQRINHFDDQDRKIVEQVVVHGEVPPNFKRFVAESKTQTDTVLGPVEITFAVPVPAENIVQAYGMLEGVLIRAAAEQRAAARERAEKKRTEIAIAGVDAIPGMGPEPRGKRRRRRGRRH